MRMKRQTIFAEDLFYSCERKFSEHFYFDRRHTFIRMCMQCARNCITCASTTLCCTADGIRDGRFSGAEQFDEFRRPNRAAQSLDNPWIVLSALNAYKFGRKVIFINNECVYFKLIPAKQKNKSTLAILAQRAYCDTTTLAPKTTWRTQRQGAASSHKLRFRRKRTFQFDLFHL